MVGQSNGTSRVFQGAGGPPPPQPLIVAPIVGDPPGMTLAGSTAHFDVFYNNPFYQFASAVLATCEADYAQLTSWFGGAPPGRFAVLVRGTPGGGGEHSSCDAEIINCSPGRSPSDLNWTRLVMVAEAEEVFAYFATGGGFPFAPWDCGFSKGEGLSIALAFVAYRDVELTDPGSGYATQWLNSQRPNWVDDVHLTDTDPVANSCSVLFLNFLRYELKYSWQSIIATQQGGWLATTYSQLTGFNDGFARFAQLMAVSFPPSSIASLNTNNPFPLTRSGGLIVQGQYGGMGNFEVVIPLASGGLGHFWRDSDAAFPVGSDSGIWIESTSFFTDTTIDAVSLIQGNFGDPGNLEGVYRTGDQLWHFWRDAGGWHRDERLLTPITSGARGTPALIQGQFGVRGNFELVTPLAGGGLQHFWRNNDDAANDYPWAATPPFAQKLGEIDDVSLIQSNFLEYPGNLALIARVGGEVFYYERGPFGWVGNGKPFVTNAIGAPSFVQGHFGVQGNYEAVIPVQGGGLAHVWRDNDDVQNQFPWHISGVFLQDLGLINAATVIQSNYGNPGNLDGVVRIGTNLWHFYRDQIDWSHTIQPIIGNAKP